MKIFLCEKRKTLIEKSVRQFNRWIPEKVIFCDCPIKNKPGLAKKIAKIKVINPESTLLNKHPFPMELNYEEKRLRNCLCGQGVVYDGACYMKIIRGQLESDMEWFDEKPVYITSDYVATMNFEEKRYHLRYAVFGFPVVISLPGLIEAPARSREYYIAENICLKHDEDTNDFLSGFEDKRLPRVLAGILLQAWFYFMDGSPFCSDPNCSLFNAHWQKDLLASQKDEPYVLCDKHFSVLARKCKVC